MIYFFIDNKFNNSDEITESKYFMKNKNTYFVHNDGRNDYDVLVKDDGSAWVLKEEYFFCDFGCKPLNLDCKLQDF